MNDHESRINAMLAPGQGTWDLNEKDIAAIQWLHDFAVKHKDKADKLARENLRLIKLWHEASKRLNRRADEIRSEAEWMRSPANCPAPE